MTSSREEMWRLFVAIPLNDEVRTAATASATLLQARLGRDGWRWVDPEMFHLTLAFLGNVPSSSPRDRCDSCLGGHRTVRRRWRVPFRSSRAGGVVRRQ